MEAAMNFKIYPVLVLFFCSLFPVIGLAQNKVVVIPLLDTVETHTLSYLERRLGRKTLHIRSGIVCSLKAAVTSAYWITHQNHLTLRQTLHIGI